MAAKLTSVRAKRTIIMHAYLYSAARHAIRAAEENETGRTFSIMHCLAFSAFTIEAHLNYVGEKKVKNWTAIERKLRVAEKLELVCATIGLSLAKGGKLYNSFKRIFRFRNLIAHGRSESVKHKWIANEDTDPRKQPETEWEKLCTLKTAKRYLNEAEELVRTLHQAAGFTDDPFGSLGHGTSVEEPFEPQK